MLLMGVGFPGPPHAPEWNGALSSLDGFDPFILLLLRWRRNAIDHVVPLDHAPVCLRLAGFDKLALVVGNVELKAILITKKREEREKSLRMAGVSEQPHPLRLSSGSERGLGRTQEEEGRWGGWPHGISQPASGQENVMGLMFCVFKNCCCYY